MIELVIVVTITPLIVGALAAGLIAMFSLQSGVSNRLSDSADAQVVSTSFTKDVETASSITTDPTLNVCGSGTQLMGLQVTNTSGVISYISYVEQVQSGSIYSLIRNTCTSASTLSSPASSTTISYDVLAPGLAGAACAVTSPPTCQVPPSVYQTVNGVMTLETAPTTSWIVVEGVTSVKFPIYEPQSKYSYALQAQPAAGTSTLASNLSGPTSGPSCGFALPGTGYYATTLCFIDFTVLDGNDATGHTVLSDAEGRTNCTTPVIPGYEMSVAVPGGYTMTFCLSITPGVSSDIIDAVEVPISEPDNGGAAADGGSVSNGRGFLGNAQANPSGVIAPFYSGIGCADNTSTSHFWTDQSGGSVMLGTLSCIRPAIFQETNHATDTVKLTDIVVTDPEGADASGYEVVTADAETTDPGGSITWTSTPYTGSPNDFGLLPNSSTSDLGNACNTVPTSDENTYTTAVQDIDNGDSTVTIGGQQYSGSLVGGIGTDSVTCSSNWQTEVNTGTHPYTYWDRTGTAMLGVTPATTSGTTAYVTISAKIIGEGYNAVAFGLLLP